MVKRSNTKGLNVERLHKSFQTARHRVEVLKGITFSLSAGQDLAIIGPSGSGKSTLLHILGTLDTPSSGAIRIGGQDPFALAEPEKARFRNRVIGFVFQDHHLLPGFSVLENVLLAAAAAGPPTKAAVQRAHGLIQRVGLGQRSHHRPAELSGGERQRVAVARALINQPQLLLCDEPTGNLDASSAATVAELLFELHRKQKAILIIVTHSSQLARRFGRKFELKEGHCYEV